MIQKKPIIIDTDPGDDDAVSILWALAQKHLDVLALTVVSGNVDLDKCVTNALRVLEVSGRTEIPVYAGAFRPIQRPKSHAEWIHGADGLGDAGFPEPTLKVRAGCASAEMIRIAREAAQPVTILALGPLTNVALAVLMDDEFPKYVEQIIFMGGAVRVPGNESPAASFNVAIDPEAAQIVYESGIPVVQVGLDVCDQVTQRVEDLDAIGRCGSKITDFILKLLAFRREKAVKLIRDASGQVVGQIRATEEAGRQKGGIGLNDLTATGYLINPAWFTTKHVRVAIDTKGLCPGQTIADFTGLWGRTPNCHFAHGVDGQALVAQWVKDMGGTV